MATRAAKRPETSRKPARKGPAGKSPARKAPARETPRAKVPAEHKALPEARRTAPEIQSPMPSRRGEDTVRAWVATADMGLGHQRAAYPLRNIAEGGLMTLGKAENTSPSEH